MVKFSVWLAETFPRGIYGCFTMPLQDLEGHSEAIAEG